MKIVGLILLIWMPFYSLAQTTVYPKHIKLSSNTKPNTVYGDFDGDKKQDTARLVYHTINKSYGLQIAYANRKKRYFGMGINQDAGLDNLEWVGEFLVVYKGTVVWDNVDDNGEIISEDEVPPAKKFPLPNDGIYMHAREACGGGILYFDKSKTKWVIKE